MIFLGCLYQSVQILRFIQFPCDQKSYIRYAFFILQSPNGFKKILMAFPIRHSGQETDQIFTFRIKLFSQSFLFIFSKRVKGFQCDTVSDNRNPLWVHTKLTYQIVF